VIVADVGMSERKFADLIQEKPMDAVVIGVIIALAGTLLVIG
jgi:hypothetical protein